MTLPHKRQAIICDLDGTLSDCTHRRHLVIDKPKRWDEFYDRCDEDPVNQPVVTVLKCVAPLYRIVIVTGRVERVRDKTVAWVNRYSVPCDLLLMRPDGDYIEDHLLKERILDQHILPVYDVHFAIDDRDRVVQMWRRRGIQCFQAADGKF